MAAHREFKDRLYTQFARIGKAVASPHRIEILELLAQGERTVDSLATEIGLSLANTSQHLQALRQAALVESRKDGLYVYTTGWPIPRCSRSVKPFGALRSERSRISSGWYIGISAAERGRSRSGCVTCSNARARATCSFLTHVQPANTSPAILPGPSPFPSTICSTFFFPCQRTRNTSRTAAAPTASMQTVPSSCCGRVAGVQGGWPKASPNGGLRGFQSSREMRPQGSLAG